MRRLFLLCCVLPILLVACREPEAVANPDIQLEVSVLPDPPELGEAAIRVLVTDAEGEALSNATIEARGDMNHAGMAPVLRSAEASDTPGEYVIPFEWTMGGDWFVDITVTLPDGSTTTERFNYRVSSG